MTHTSAPHHRSDVLPVLLTCVGYGYFTINDAINKFLTAKFHFSQIMVTNGFLLSVFLAIFAMYFEGRKAFRTKKLKLMLWRAVVGQVSAVTTLLSLPHIHLTTFYTLVFTSPFWVSLMAVFVLKERLEAKRLAVILLGFAVVVFIFRPGGGLFNIWAVLVCLGALTYSYALIIMRQIGAHESRYLVLIFACSMNVLVAAPLLPGHFIMPTPYEGGLFVLVSLLGSIGLLCVSYGIQVASSPAVVVPYHYTQLVWGALLGYFIFQEVPSLNMMIGAAIIITAGLWLIYSEARNRRKVLL